MKSNKNIEYKFLNKEDIYSAEYVELQNKIHGNNGFEHRIGRIRHYLETGDLKILVASVDGVMVGQSSAFKVMAIIESKEQPFYWGCDTFLLSQCRGLGIGKELQRILHKTCPNFSSAWYSPINGIIKRKCGGVELLPLKFTYYPVSYFCGLIWQLASAKLFKKLVSLNTSIPYFYYNLNKLFTHNHLKAYEICEVSCENNEVRISEFMEDSLKHMDFHIKRSPEFLQWAYGWKKYTMLEFRLKGTTEAVVAFSEVHDATHVIARFMGISILDLIVSPDSKLTKQDIIMHVINYHRKRNIKLDGIISFEQMRWFPKFIYPKPYAPLLSTYGKKVSKGYISMIDQDMDQL